MRQAIKPSHIFVVATKCQKERHMAIEAYEEKFLQTFKTMPVRLLGAQDNQPTDNEQAEEHWNSGGGSPIGDPMNNQGGGKDAWNPSHGGDNGNRLRSGQ